MGKFYLTSSVIIQISILKGKIEILADAERIIMIRFNKIEQMINFVNNFNIEPVVKCYSQFENKDSLNNTGSFYTVAFCRIDNENILAIESTRKGYPDVLYSLINMLEVNGFKKLDIDKVKTEQEIIFFGQR